jgi:hypothetical protein
LIIVLLTALGARPTDVMGGTSTKDTRSDLPGLRYGDVKLSVDFGGIPKIKGRVCMRSNKGQKLDAGKYNNVTLNALPDTTDNIVDPIKLILIMAIRSGNICGSIGDILHDTSKRIDRLVQWKFPDRPVLCTTETNGIMNWDELANSMHSNHVLVKAVAAMCGSKDLSITPAQLRYDFACDLGVVDQDSLFSEYTDDRISEFLAHSSASRRNDVMNGYTEFLAELTLGGSEPN